MMKMNAALETPMTQALTEWTKIFPKQVTENYASSVTFMKQLTVVAVSTITYIKDAFLDDSYTTEQFGGSKLKILKTKCRDELAQFLSSALRQAFEAFDKKYLQQLAVCFYDGECKAENLVEYHVFEYTYDDVATVTVRSKARGDHTGPTTKQFTFDKVREQTKQLIKSIIVIMQSCQYEAIENFDVSLRLYYNEDAPEGYQAPGFSAPTECDHLQPTASEAIQVGCVETPYHRLVASTYVRDNMGASHEVIPSQNLPMMSQMEQNVNASTMKTESECSHESLLCCPCNKGGSDADAGPLLTCQYCNMQQHAVCFGLTAGRARHCCEGCAERDPALTPTDPRLLALSGNKRESLCMFRRALWECARAGSVCARALTGALRVSDANAARLMRMLHAHAVVPAAGVTDLITPQKVSMEGLKSVMKQFFLVSEEENIVDRLVAETIASQERRRRPDPVGDVLGPLQKVSLQNASNLGKVIKNYMDHQNKSIEDPTLKQYKEAILSNYQLDEDLPLSGSLDPIKDITNLGSKRNSKRKINENNYENKPRSKAGVRRRKN